MAFIVVGFLGVAPALMEADADTGVHGPRGPGETGGSRG
jgi:hypothetical protein